MWRSLRFLVAFIWVIIATYGCASADTTTPGDTVLMHRVNSDAPCWVDKPDCQAVAGESAVYFVGQSESPLANPGQPARETVHAARRDAEVAYARFLGVDIETSSTMRTVFDNESYRMQFNEDLREQVTQRIGALRKADQYNVAHRLSADGEPLWTVFVLLKVSEADVAKHRVAISTERIQKESEPAPPDLWVASLFNIDDSVSIYVNDTKINQCSFSRECEVQLTPHFKSGVNKVRLVYRNDALFWTYGYEVRRNDEVMYTGRCGQVWVYGCGLLNIDLGDVHVFDFEVAWRKESTR